VLSAVDISLQYADRRLLDGVTFHIGPQDRIGLVGANGSGKSTLLRILLGETTPDSGVVTRAKYVTVGYLPQEGTALAGRTLYDEVESVFADIVRTREQLEQLHEAMATVPHDTPEFQEMLDIFGELQHRLEAADGFRLSSSIEKVLIGLGFTQRDFGRQTDEFSGGWQMRIALAKLLLLQPSLLLLDEPTNHLDLDSLQWLEEYLQSYQGAVMLVSHDRRFLDTMTRRTFELSLGTLADYAGNFSFFLDAREERRELQRAARRGFRAVVQPPTMVGADLRVSTELVRLQQNFASKPSESELVLHVQLIDVRTRVVVATRTFEATEAAPSEDPYGGVIAANRAIERLLAQLAAFCVTESARLR